MTVTVRAMTSDDFEWASELLSRYNAARMTAAERTAHGFVQGAFTAAKIQAHVAATGGLVAEVDGVPAGLLLTAAPGTATAPPARALDEAARARFGEGGYLLYGPVVVDEAHRRRGVLAALVARLRAAPVGGYPVAAAFIEASNPVSLAAHERLGMRVFDEYGIDDRRYLALALDLARGHEGGPA